jgi:hypothetical protein
MGEETTGVSDNGKGEARIKRQFDRIERKFPQISGFLNWLRKPQNRFVRIPLAILLMAGGVFSFLPVLGIWMLPLGLLLLALDVALLRTPIAAALTRGTRKFQAWRRARRPGSL